MKFSHDWPKFSNHRFTTIRKDDGYYRTGRKYLCRTPTKTFYAKIVHMRHIRKEDITEEIAQADADTDKESLIKLLERFYGRDYDGFVLTTLEKVNG
jgi:hypothetical protein